MPLNTRIEKAAEILAKYNLTLAPEWAGKINCWHRWHENDFYLCWLTTYEEYIERINEIEMVKPDNEKPLRFLAFRPVKDEVLRFLDLATAKEAYYKAIDPASEAYDKAKATAWEAYYKAIDPARIKCHFDAGVDIMALHAIECSDVPLIEFTNKLKF